jgi:hypothetical protein
MRQDAVTVLAAHAEDIKIHGAQTPDLAGVVLVSIASITAAQHVVLFQHIPTVAIPHRAVVQP